MSLQARYCGLYRPWEAERPRIPDAWSSFSNNLRKG